MPRPLFTLSPRLAVCAGLVRPGSPLIDVGTDHAYLPIWLIRSGVVPRAVCCDINPGPLASARRHARQYHAEDRLRLVLSDGLTALHSEDGDDIVMAGMGGELILQMVSLAPWLRNPDKRLILQPMSAAGELRAGLWALGFPISVERAVIDRGKVYSAFCTQYQGELPPVDPLYIAMGRLSPGGPAVHQYAVKTVRRLMDQLRGTEARGEDGGGLRQLIHQIAQQYPLDSGEEYGKNL